MNLEKMIGTVPFETFKNPICRGSFILNSACGRCEKCKWMQARIYSMSLQEHPANTIPYPTTQEEETLP